MRQGLGITVMKRGVNPACHAAHLSEHVDPTDYYSRYTANHVLLYLSELVDLVAHADDVLLPGGQDGDACLLRPLDVPIAYKQGFVF